MNTLRKLVEAWSKDSRDAVRDARHYLDANDLAESRALTRCADSLSATLPAWERLENMLEELVKGATDSDHLVLVHVPSVKAALKEVRGE